MNLLKRVLPGAIMLLVAVACNEQKTEKNTPEVSSVFKGSDTEFEMIQSLTAAYADKEPNAARYEVLGGGSESGINAFIDGKALVANSSRKMTESEMTRAQKNGLTPLEVIIGVDAIAIITHPKVGVDSLSVDQIRSIFNGSVRNWKEVGGNDLEIHLYGRDKHSGTHDYIAEKLLRGKFYDAIKELKTNKDVIAAVKADPQGIGYVGAGSLIGEHGLPNGEVWAAYVYIDGDRAYSPYQQEEILAGNYPLSRPLFQYYNGVPEGDLKNFLKFVLSEEGQDLVQKSGYYPINGFHQQLNTYNGISF